MRKISEMVDYIDDELEDAKIYAEKYVEYKSENNMTNANKFKEMSMDELKHSSYWHQIAVESIETIKNVLMPPVEMQKVWDESHARYVERTAWIKQMLSM